MFNFPASMTAEERNQSAAAEIQRFIANKAINDPAGATHKLAVPREVYLAVGDNADEQRQLARVTYEANKIKEPITIREMLTDKFTLFFSVSIHGPSAEAQPVVKDVAKFLGQQLAGEVFPGHQQLTCVIYAAEIPDDQLCKAQVVFPDIIVNLERWQTIRAALIDKLDSPKGSPEVAQKLRRLSGNNSGAAVITPIENQAGIEIPLSATTRPPARVAEAPLNPVAMATITNTGIQKKDAPGPDQRFVWVEVGLKRRDAANPANREMTDWNPPRQFRKGGSEGKSGSSGKDSGGSGGTTGAGSSGGKYTTAKDGYKG